MGVLCAACGDRPADVGRADAAARPASSDALAAPQTVRFVKLEQLSEWNGKAWAAVSELNLIDATGATVDRAAWTASADSADANDVPAHAIDGNPGSVWHTRWNGDAPPPPHALVVNLGAPVKVSGFRYLPRQDGMDNGTIAKYRFYVSADGVNWGEPVSTGDFSIMSARRIEKTVVFAAQTPNHAPVAEAPPAQATPLGQAVSVQVGASDVDADPLVYASSGLPPGLSMSDKTGLIFGTPIAPGDYLVTVSVKDSKGDGSSVDFRWKVEPPAAAPDAAPAAPGEVRFVRLEQVSEIGGKPWGAVAELNLLDARGRALPRTGWTASADSSDVSDRPANAIDGNPASLWHSRWDGASPPPPHSLIIDLGRPAKVRGFRYLPRQDRLSNGTIAKYRFYTSVDGADWRKPVAEGDFSTMGPPGAEKTVMLK